MLYSLTLDPFLIRAFTAGIGIAIIAAIMGCFVVWRRMAYFGDSLAHSALLGIALGYAAGISPHLGTVMVCSAFAIILLLLQRTKLLATDTLLGILAHGALSIGVVTISVLQQKVNLHGYLFGDILTVTTQEIIWIYIGGTVVLATLFYYWSSLVLMTICEDLARAEHIRTTLMHILLMFLMTIVVAVSIRIVGILLITSMLIIPAAAARQLVRSPEAMAIGAALFGVLSVICGMVGAMQWDTPAGPSIVATATILFMAILPLSRLFRR